MLATLIVNNLLSGTSWLTRSNFLKLGQRRPSRFEAARRLQLVLSAFLATLALSGCLSPPGMTVRTSLNPQEPGGVTMPQWLRTFEPVSDANGMHLETGPPAKAVILPITPDLLRLLKANRPPDTLHVKEVEALFAAAPTYRIGVGDVLNIVVWDHPEIAPRAVNPTVDTGGVLVIPGYNVTPEGVVQFPYVGTVQLAGLTELEARDKLAAALGKFFKEPQVTVQMQAYRSGRIYIEGEVRAPGLQAINDIAMTLPVALGRAGSLLPTADRSRVSLSRDGVTTEFNLQKLMDRGVDLTRVLLRNGDLLRVPSVEDSKVFVLGEVERVGPQLMREGKLTLNEALGGAEGIRGVSGDARQIYVVRNGAAGNAEVYHLDAKTVANYALADGFELQPRDVVFVDPVPLVNFNRVISLIIPSAIAVNTTRAAVE